MKNNIGKVLSCGRHFEFSSVNAENSLVHRTLSNWTKTQDAFSSVLLQKRRRSGLRWGFCGSAIRESRL